MATQYKLQIGRDGSTVGSIGVKNTDGTEWGIPLDPANTDYQNFKKEILADEAQLEDADGNLMSPEQAKAYVATLP